MALITFDLDGVLQRSAFRKGVFPHIWARLAPFAARAAGLTDAEAARAEVARRIRAEFVRRQLAGEWVESYNWDAIVAAVAASLGYTGEPISVAALVQRYATPEYIHTYPGAPEALAVLAAAGHTLKVVTNGFAVYQEPVMRALGFMDYFAGFITPDRAGTGKPWPEIFHQAGSPPALHVGDTLIHDMYGANLARFAGCWVWPDLPPGWLDLTPAERAAHPDLAAAMAGRLEVERQWYLAPPVAPDQCRPACVVASLHELPAAVDRWLATAAGTPPGRPPA